MEEKQMTLEELNAMNAGTLMGQLGIRYTCAQSGKIEATMPVSQANCQPYGILHGGASLALAETLAGVGSQMYCREDEVAVGMQVSGNHVSSALLGDVVSAVAVPIHLGKTTHVWSVDIQNSQGILVSSVRVVNYVVKKQKDINKDNE